MPPLDHSSSRAFVNKLAVVAIADAAKRLPRVEQRAFFAFLHALVDQASLSAGDQQTVVAIEKPHEIAGMDPRTYQKHLSHGLHRLRQMFEAAPNTWVSLALEAFQEIT